MAVNSEALAGPALPRLFWPQSRNTTRLIMSLAESRSIAATILTMCVGLFYNPKSLVMAGKQKVPHPKKLDSDFTACDYSFEQVQLWSSPPAERTIRFSKNFAKVCEVATDGLSRTINRTLTFQKRLAKPGGSHVIEV
jgi:hypothetical protein